MKTSVNFVPPCETLTSHAIFNLTEITEDTEEEQAKI